MSIGAQDSFVFVLPANLQLSLWAQFMTGADISTGSLQGSLSAGTQLVWQPKGWLAVGAQGGVGPDRGSLRAQFHRHRYVVVHPGSAMTCAGCPRNRQRVGEPTRRLLLGGSWRPAVSKFAICWTTGLVVRDSDREAGHSLAATRQRGSKSWPHDHEVRTAAINPYQ